MSQFTKRHYSVLALALLLIAAVGVHQYFEDARETQKYTERTREIQGVWLYEFESSNFFEGATRETVKKFKRNDAGWLEFDGQESLENAINIDANDRCYIVSAMELRFFGKRLQGQAGHLGMWSSRFEIDELVSARKLDWPECDSPYHWEKQ